MQMYFEISDAESIAKIDAALNPILNFDEKLLALKNKYKADQTFVFNSIDRGLEFSYLWFKDYPLHIDTLNEFKVSSEKYKTGYGLRPRKSNKKFYSEFMKDLEDVDYSALKLALFGDIKCRPSISYSKRNGLYYIDSTLDLVVGYKELTASQYIELIEEKEEG